MQEHSISCNVCYWPMAAISTWAAASPGSTAATDPKPTIDRRPLRPSHTLVSGQRCGAVEFVGNIRRLASPNYVKSTLAPF